MTTQLELCPIWNSNAATVEKYKASGYFDHRTRVWHVEHSPRAAGGFILPDVLLNAELIHMSDEQRARLTTWLIDQRDRGNEQPLITKDIIDYIKTKPRLPTQQRADRLLRFIDVSAETVADYVQISPEDCDTACAWSESVDWKEVYYFLGELKNKGWIQAGTFAGNMFKGWVTIDGHNRIAEVGDSVPSSQVSVLQDSFEPGDHASSDLTTEAGSKEGYTHDFFICHASEDKDELVRALADSLRSKGAKVWYDEFTLRIGSRLRRSIDQGLASSRFGIVVVSANFFAKDWPQTELDGLVALDAQNSERILPIWHGVTRVEVAQHSPTLADILALDTAQKSIEEIARELMNIL